MRTLRDSLWHSLAFLDKYTELSRVGPAGGDVVLMYHSVGEPGLFGNVNVERFRRDLQRFQKTFRFVDLPEILTTDGAERRLAVTFDDGYGNFLGNALPTLREFDVPVTLFLPSQFVLADTTDLIRERLSLSTVGASTILDSADIEWLVTDDLVTIGNHTRTHPDLTSLADRSQRREEIVGAKRELEEAFGIEVTRFSYPHGMYDESTVEVVRKSHDLAVTSDNSHVVAHVDPHTVPRIRGHNPEHVLKWELTGSSQLCRAGYERLTGTHSR